MRARPTRGGDSLARVAQLVSNAVFEWPRLDHALLAGVEGREVEVSCTSSRIWVRFSEQPKRENTYGDEVHWLAKRRPYWLPATLNSIGYLHWRLIQRGKIDASSNVGSGDEQAFSQLTRALEQDSVHYFVSVKRDLARDDRDQIREMVKHAERFASDVLTTVVSFGSLKDPRIEQPIPTHLKFARACISVAETLVGDTPNCARLFGSQCADDFYKKTGTPERKVLEKVLKTRGCRVVMWKDAEELRERSIVPLVFPPSFKTHSADGPCVLLDFDEFLTSRS